MRRANCADLHRQPLSAAASPADRVYVGHDYDNTVAATNDGGGATWKKGERLQYSLCWFLLLLALLTFLLVPPATDLRLGAKRVNNRGNYILSSSESKSDIANAAVESPSPWLCDRIRKRERPVRIACLGDSITRGDGSHEPNAVRKSMVERGNYPMVLQRLLAGRVTAAKNATATLMPADVHFFDVRNFGTSGATACGESDLPYIKSRELASAVVFRPDVVVIMLGTNDAKAKNWESENSRCGGREAFVTGMRQILKAMNADLTPAVTATGPESPAEVGVVVDSAYPPTPPPPKVLIVPPPDVIQSRWGILRHLIPRARESLSDLVVGMNRSSTMISACKDGRNDERGERGAAVAVRLSSELAIPTHPKLFVNDKVHLSRKGSEALACSVFLELMDWCGVTGGVLGLDSSPGTGGDSSGGWTKAPQSGGCTGALEHDFLSGWKISAERCRGVLRDPVVNTDVPI